MWYHRHTIIFVSTVFVLLPANTYSATVQDVFTLNARVPRDNKYYTSRYGGSSSLVPSNTRPLKPEDSLEAREATQSPVEKRCTRCDSSYADTRYPGYDSRSRYDDRRYRPSIDYNDRGYDRGYDRGSDRGYERGSDRYDRDRYDDKRYDRYDRYDDRYDRYDRKPAYDRYDRERYDRYDRDNRYDRNDNRDRYSDLDYERGYGYDNRGYDYRDRGYNDQDTRGSGGSRGGYSSGRPESGAGYWGTTGYANNWNYGAGRGDDRNRYDYDGFKPWDETYRGISGWDERGRGFYFASGIPEVGAEHWGSSGTGRYGGYNTRPRDPYDGYRTTSYLFDRPSSTTTDRTPDSDSGITQNPQLGSG